MEKGGAVTVMDEGERTEIALLRLIEQNRITIEEYEKWAATADSRGLVGVAELIGKAAAETETASTMLREAMGLLG